MPTPSWIVEAIRGPRNSNTGSIQPAFELPEVIKEGHRDDILYRFACSLRAQDLNLNTALMLMKMAWERCEQPPVATTDYEWQQAVTKLHNAYGRYDSGRSEGYEAASLEAAGDMADERLLSTTPHPTRTPASPRHPEPNAAAHYRSMLAPCATCWPDRGHHKPA